MLGGILEAGGRLFTTVNKIAVNDLLADQDPELHIKGSQGAADVPTGVAQLQQSHVYDVQGSA